LGYRVLLQLLCDKLQLAAEVTWGHMLLNQDH
jgi:hypothetical protein